MTGPVKVFTNSGNHNGEVRIVEISNKTEKMKKTYLFYFALLTLTLSFSCQQEKYQIKDNHIDEVHASDRTVRGRIPAGVYTLDKDINYGNQTITGFTIIAPNSNHPFGQIELHITCVPANACGNQTFTFNSFGSVDHIGYGFSYFVRLKRIFVYRNKSVHLSFLYGIDQCSFFCGSLENATTFERTARKTE